MLKMNLLVGEEAAHLTIEQAYKLNILDKINHVEDSH